MSWWTNFRDKAESVIDKEVGDIGHFFRTTFDSVGHEAVTFFEHNGLPLVESAAEQLSNGIHLDDVMNNLKPQARALAKEAGVDLTDVAVHQIVGELAARAQAQLQANTPAPPVPQTAGG